MVSRDVAGSVTAAIARRGEAHLIRALQLFSEGRRAAVLQGRPERTAFLVAYASRLGLAHRGESRGFDIWHQAVELTRAERYFREALVDLPAHVEARLRHGRVLGDLGRHEEAVRN